MGFLILNVFLALLVATAFWIAMRPTGCPSAPASKMRGGRLQRCSANLTVQRVKRRRDRRSPSAD